jgi:hypothetical protein
MINVTRWLQKQPEKRNLVRNWWEFHREDTRCTTWLKKFQDTKNKKHEKTQKQIHKFRGDLNKHQRETDDNINRKKNELKLKIKNF